MGRIRINPDTGVIEEQNGFLDDVTNTWWPKKDDDGNVNRVNKKTGELEKIDGFINDALGIWTPKT